MSISECQVLFQQLTSVLMVLFLATGFTMFLNKSISSIKSTSFKFIQSIKNNKEFILIPSFVAISSFLLLTSPLKIETKQNINSVIVFQGKEVVPCKEKKDKETKISFANHLKSITICSL